jgi:hypothetical protein
LIFKTNDYFLKNVSSPLLEEVERARRATISEDDEPKGEVHVENVEETRIENEEKELVMAFDFLTLKYKDKKLEKTFPSHLPSKFVLIIEIILSIFSFILFYIYFYLTKTNKFSIILMIYLSIKLLLTLILIILNEFVLKYSILIHFFSLYYFLSPLIVILISNDNYEIVLPSLVLFLSTYLTLGSSLSHLFKMLVAFISISIYFPFIIFKQQIQSLFSFLIEFFLFKKNFCL